MAEYCSFSHREAFADTILESLETHYQSLIANRPNTTVILFNILEHNDYVFGNFASKISSSFYYQVRKLNFEMMKLSQRCSNLFLNDINSLRSTHSPINVNDLRMSTNMDMVLSLEFVPYVAKNLLQIIAAQSGQVKKAIILDLDNLIWGGEVADVNKIFIEVLDNSEIILTKNNVIFTYCKSLESANQLEQQFPNCQSIRCDFTREESLNNLIEIIPGLKIEMLVNNAIVGFQRKHFHKISPSEFSQSFQSNVLPTIRITKAALTHFRKQKFGKILTILSSFIINKPPVGLSEYVAGKAYLSALSRSWAIENSQFNVTANCIAPSLTLSETTPTTDERILEEMTNSHPLKRLLTAEEISEVVLFFSHANAHINGVCLPINAASDFLHA